MLYQRYFLRMNQSNTTHILSLLLALIISLAAVHIIFIPIKLSEREYTAEWIKRLPPNDSGAAVADNEMPTSNVAEMLQHHRHRQKRTSSLQFDDDTRNQYDENAVDDYASGDIDDDDDDDDFVEKLQKRR